MIDERCDCDDCAESEKPCAFDCGPGEDACRGCQESARDRAEDEFNVGTAQGRS